MCARLFTHVRSCLVMHSQRQAKNFVLTAYVQDVP